MSALNGGFGLLLLLAVGWKLYQLGKAPHDRPLRAVVLCLVSAAVAYPFGLQAVAEAVDGAVGAGTAKLVQNVFLLVTVYWIMCFYLFSAADAGGGRRRARWELVPLVATAVLMTVATVLTPEGLRGTSYADADMTVPGLAIFYLGGGVYLAYVLCVALVWTWRYARVSEPPLSTGLWIVAAGLAGMVVGSGIRAVLVVVRATGAATIPGLVSALSLLLALSIPLFVIGLTYPGLTTRFAAVRVWSHHRRMYHRLGPLWTVLHDAFPQDALNRVPAGGWRDAVRLRGVTRLYYRRVIECRDGLVRVSPYLAAGHEGADLADSPALADALTAALRSSRASEPVATKAVFVATPEGEGLDADVRQLVALSDALRARVA
ncbi:hypothetical protein CFN78_12700 [Amycolatopsis antarctica]|uniref:DUF6545 domain-containing protein n=1 Tax=Amycolatopsis antarctica TaxID=1854586 RepID=A0A263D3Q3_9PSEU|nr:MAB_1171c family putative transporter [Amycolatopsis antarctica]OZM73070.1 hypothetical protein CFN78_12700 [Amycolatopsis antarctica]